MPQIIITAIVAGAGVLAQGGAVLVALKVAGVAVGLQLLRKLFGRDVGTQRDVRSSIQTATAPARWILGRARVGGVLAHYVEVEGEERTDEDGVSDDVHLALLVAEGPCEQIERVWVDGEEMPIARSARGGPGQSGHLVDPAVTSKFANYLRIVEYFDADGTQGDSLRDASPGWTSEHKVTGKSWVHVHLRQPAYGNDTDKRFWFRLPQIEFLVKGLKFTWPGQATPTWTENAAAVRWWWLRTRRGIPEGMIDEASVTAALAVCGKTVTVQIPAGSDYAGYNATSGRYTSNGVVYSDDAVERVEDELDYSVAGLLGRG